MSSKIELTRTQMRAIVPHSHKTRYAMDTVHVVTDGMSESTDGKCLIRVYPKVRREGVMDEALFIGRKAAIKAGREMKPAREASAKKDAVKAPPAVADSETGELSYVARNGLRVVIKNAVMSKSAKEAENKYFPPVDDVIDEYSNRDVKFKTTMSVALFERVVKALKDAGCENVRLDFLTRERGIRFASETDDSFLLGLLMPMQGGKLDDAMPPKPQKDQDDLIIA